MTEKKKTKKRNKLSKSAIVLIVGLCIIFIPLTVYGGILLSAQLQTGKPIFGDRFKGDLDPAITNSEISTLEAEISSMSQVEECKIELKSAQLRINVDVVDTMEVEKMDELLDEIYNKVNAKLPVGTYFTSANSKKMYDLSINVYNFIDAENENMNYVILTKNAMMDKYSKQVVSEALDSELASELRGENLPEENPEENVE